MNPENESPITKAVQLFNEAVEYSPYLYFELAYTRTTEWMCHLIDRTGGEKVKLAVGQSIYPEEACGPVIEALENILSQVE